MDSMKFDFSSLIIFKGEPKNLKSFFALPIPASLRFQPCTGVASLPASAAAIVESRGAKATGTGGVNSFEELLTRSYLLIGDSGIRRVDPKRGRQCNEMILFLDQDVAKALSDGKLVELVCLLYTATVFTNGFLLIF